MIKENEVEKPKRKMVSISNENLETLAEQRQGFETPDQCLKRILSQHPCSKNPSKDEPEEESNKK